LPAERRDNKQQRDNERKNQNERSKHDQALPAGDRRNRRSPDASDSDIGLSDFNPPSQQSWRRFSPWGT
jgi:hypothetical protein